MKKTSLVGLLVLLCAFAASAQPTNLINYGLNNGTNPGIVFKSPVYVAQNPALLLQFGAITNLFAGSYTTNGVTNCLAFDVQISIDAANSNWITLDTFVPNGTNGEVQSQTPILPVINLPLRVVARSTNSLNAGALKTK